MKKEQRFYQILQYLSLHESLQINTIAEMLGVTPMTIRRDLEELEKRSLLVRTHGGAISPHASASVDTTLLFRTSVNNEAKDRIAKAAVETVHSGQRLFLASGSTITAFSQQLTNIPNLTIITDSINIAYSMSVHTYHKVIVTGGEIDPVTQTASGILSEDVIHSFNYDAAYLGATAIDRDGQVYLGSLAEFSLMQCLLNLSCPTYILADSSKIGKTDFVRAGKMQSNHILITDDGVDPGVLEQIRKHHQVITTSE